MPAPYDYTIGDIASPQQSFLQGIQMVDFMRKREQDQAAAIEAKRKEAELQALYAEALQPGAKPEVFQRLNFAIDPKGAALSRMQQLNDAQQDAMIGNMGSVLAPFVAGKPDLAIQIADELINAMENSPNPDQKSLQALKASRQVFSQSPELAQVSLTTSMMGLGEKGRKAVNDIFEAMKKPVEQRKAAAEAQQAEIKIQGLQEQQAAELLKAQSEAEQARIKAKYAEKIAIEDLKKKASDRGLTDQQTRQLLASTSKLQTEGRMLQLDFEAALQGLPLPSKGGGQTTVGAATEDERKAAGWLAQATNAYTNMLKAMYTKEGKPTKAEAPGIMETMALEPLKGIVRSPERQQFVQATSSLSEALLRAATGAGVNKEEAAQKVAELTPVWSDDEATKKQKLDAIPMYLQSLQARAGRAAPKDYQVPTAQQRNVVVSY
jgi:hypothetical protein